MYFYASFDLIIPSLGTGSPYRRHRRVLGIQSIKEYRRP